MCLTGTVRGALRAEITDTMSSPMVGGCRTAPVHRVDRDPRPGARYRPGMGGRWTVLVRPLITDTVAIF